MTFTYRHRKQIIIAILICLVVGGSAFYYYHSSFNKKKDKKVTLVLNEKKETKAKEEKVEEKQEKIMFQVDIKGAVFAPGIYSIEEGSRIIDVIEKAGGLRDDADTTVLNLSKKVFDEMVIIVYTQGEVQNFKETKEMENYVNQKCQEGIGELQNDACITENKQELTSSKISINQATKEELMTLSGVGEAKADAIIAYRDAHGGFKTLEELKEVEGIGDALFTTISENITL